MGMFFNADVTLVRPRKACTVIVRPDAVSEHFDSGALPADSYPIGHVLHCECWGDGSGLFSDGEIRDVVLVRTPEGWVLGGWVLFNILVSDSPNIHAVWLAISSRQTQV